MIYNLYQSLLRIFRALRVAIFIILSSTFSSSAGSEQPLADFIGHWQSNGDAFGNPAISTIRWSKELKEKFARIDYAINTIIDEKPVTTFSGVAYYRSLADHTYQAFWADSEGSLHPIKAKLEGKTLTSIWGVEGSKLGRTRYKIMENDAMQVTDWVFRDNEWKQFNQNVYERVNYDSTGTPIQLWEPSK